MESKYEFKYKDCIELQLIDTNCNNCKFMKRDMLKFKQQLKWHLEIEESEFNATKKREINLANNLLILAKTNQESKTAKGMLRVANKMRFEFRKNDKIQYGFCEKKEKDISFLPNICTPENDFCFEHRRVL